MSKNPKTQYSLDNQWYYETHKQAERFFGNENLKKSAARNDIIADCIATIRRTHAEYGWRNAEGYIDRLVDALRAMVKDGVVTGGPVSNQEMIKAIDSWLAADGGIDG